MAYKYQTFADLLYASYSGLQTLGFAFAKGLQKYDRNCYAFRESVIKKLKSGEMKIADLYQNIIRQLTTPHDVCWYCGRSVSECGALTADHIFLTVVLELGVFVPIQKAITRRHEDTEGECSHGERRVRREDDGMERRLDRINKINRIGRRGSAYGHAGRVTLPRRFRKSCKSCPKNSASSAFSAGEQPSVIPYLQQVVGDKEVRLTAEERELVKGRILRPICANCSRK